MAFEITAGLLACLNYRGRWSSESSSAPGILINELFRDLGIAFAAVLILIYGLVVGLFQSLLTPLIIMAAIPFSLVGMPLDEAVIDAGAVRFWSHLIKERTYATLFVLVREQSGFRCRLGRRPTDTRCAED